MVVSSGGGGSGGDAAAAVSPSPSSSSPLSLPPSSRVDALLRQKDFSVMKKDDDRTTLTTRMEWEQFFLEVLLYGTDYTLPFVRHHAAAAADGEERSGGGSATKKSTPTTTTKKQLSVKIRCQRAVSYLQDTIHKVDQARWTKTLAVPSSPTEAAEQDNNNNNALEKVDVTRLGLVDALWVVGQFVCPISDPVDSSSLAKGSSTTRSSSMAGQDDDEPQGDDSSLHAFIHIVQGLVSSTEGNKAVAVGGQQPKPQPILPLSLLQMVLDPYVLEKANVGSPTYDLFSRRYVKFQTNVLYRQKRFNLLAEESEGYAKVITLLCSLPLTLSSSSSSSQNNMNDGAATTTTINTSTKNGNHKSSTFRSTSIFCLQQLRAYIGTFDLDPNRVLAVLLDVLEEELKWTILEITKTTSDHSHNSNDVSTKQQPQRTNVTLDILLQLILQFKVSALPHLLGFLLAQYTKLASIQKQDDKDATNVTKQDDNVESATTMAPESFFHMVAFLVAHNVVDAKSIFPYFAPKQVSDAAPEKLEVWTKKRQMEVANEINEWGVVSLSSSSSKKKKQDTTAAANADDSKKDGHDDDNNNNDEEEDTTKEDKDAWKIECDECPLFHLMNACLTFGGWGPFMKLVSLCRFPPKLLSTSNESSPSAGLRRGGKKPLDVDLILLFPTIGRSVCELIKYIMDDNNIAATKRNNDRATTTTTKNASLLSKMTLLIPSQARLDSFVTTQNTVCPIENHSTILQIIFDPIMLLAGSHHAIPDHDLWSNICQLIFKCLSHRSNSKEENNVGASSSSSSSSSTNTTKLAYKTSLLMLQWYILPSLSLYPSEVSKDSATTSSSRGEELLWSILDLLPYTERYNCYDTWAIGPQSCLSSSSGALSTVTTTTTKRATGSGGTSGELRLERQALSRSVLHGNGCERTDKRLWVVKGEVMDGKATRSVLKRLAKETIKKQGELFAKVSNTSPIVAFKILIHQMQAYDNMIELMVDSFHQCSHLARDVLVWCILRNLEGSTKHGALSDAASTQMASSIESFVGELFKVFPNIEIRGILDFIMFRLLHSSGETTITPTTLSGLGIVRSLLTDAGGLEAMGGEGSFVSKQQLEGRAGSLLLRRETVSFGIVDRVSPMASRALRKVLLWGDSNDNSSNNANIGMALLLRLGQINLQLQFDDKSKWKNVILLSRVYDSTHFVWMLLLEFISCPREWDLEEDRERVKDIYAKHLPTFDELLSEYNIPISLCWAFIRPKVRYALTKEHLEMEQKEQEEANVMFDDDKDQEDDVTSESEHGDGVPKAFTTLLPDDVLPNSHKNDISSALYKTFWSLELYDLVVPVDRYMTEINRLSKEEERLLKIKQQKVAPSEKHPFDRQMQQEYKRITSTIQRLKSDETKQSNHCTYIKTKIFELQKGMFFPTTTSESTSSSKMNSNNTTIRMKCFLTHCIIPRLLCSPFDAMYCVKFVMRLYAMNVPHFHLFTFLELLFGHALKGLLLTVTEEEAQNVAIVLQEFWNILVDWRFSDNNGSLYDKKVSKKPGAVLYNERVDYERFQTLYSSWQTILFDSFVGCLNATTTSTSSRNHAASVSLRLRSALAMLNRMVRIFPTNPTFGDLLIDQMKGLSQQDGRGDDDASSMKPLFNAYLAQLIKSMNDGCWKEQTDDQRKERQRLEQVKLKERKKKQEELQREMDKDMAKADIELGNTHPNNDRERDGRRGGGSGLPLDRRGGGDRDRDRDHRHGHGGSGPFRDREDHPYDYRDRDRDRDVGGTGAVSNSVGGNSSRFTPRGRDRDRDRDRDHFDRGGGGASLRDHPRDSRGPSPAAAIGGGGGAAAGGNSNNKWSLPSSSADGGGGRWTSQQQQQPHDDHHGGTTSTNRSSRDRGGGYNKRSLAGDPPLYEEQDHPSTTGTTTTSNKRTRTLAMDTNKRDRADGGSSTAATGYTESRGGRRYADHGSSWTDRKQGRKSR